jgi:hypothetical protein
VLNALGDVTNDEIRFPDGNSEDVFNLSSFQDLSSGGGGQVIPVTTGTTRLVNEALPFTDGQQTINLGTAPASLCLVFLNGLKLRQGVDYNKNGRTLLFLSPLRATASQTDLLEALYDVSA